MFSMFTVVLSIFVVFGLFIHLIFSSLESAQTGVEATNHKQKSFTFKRHDCVKGEIKVNGETHPTFNSGTITFGDSPRNVSVKLWVRTDGCFIEDIYLCGFSVKQQIPYGLSNDNSIDYMLDIVDTAVKEEIIPHHVAKTVRQTLNDFFNFSDLKDAGIIKQAPGSADYVWVG